MGGSVRDALLDRVPQDIDVTTDARPDVIEHIVRPWADHVWPQGQRFGTVGCEKDGVTIEITTFRAEVYRPESRKPEVVYADDLETDLSRRDFTVNAMAIRLPEPELVDPFGGAADLAARRLRTPLGPEVSFVDDPLRMLRAARFVAEFQLEPAPDLVAAVETLRHRLEIVSAERIRDELSKLLMADDPSAGLWFLAETGLSDEFLPELNSMRLEQDPIHTHKDVLAHTIAVVKNTRPELILRLAALFHDVGKPKTRSFASGGVSFHHHEVVGARMTEERMRALKYPNDVVDAVVKLVYLHLRIHTYAMGWTDKAVRRYVRDAGDLLDELNHLQRCDCTTRNKNQARVLARRMDELEVAHRGAARAGGARRDPSPARRSSGDGVPGCAARARHRRRARLPARGASRPRPDRRARCLRAARRVGACPRHRACGHHDCELELGALFARARHTMVAGSFSLYCAGRGSRMVSTRKPARPSSVNSSLTLRV